MKGVLDRFEGDKAVILIETHKQELIVETHTLPAGSQVNTWFHIEKNGKHYDLKIDDTKTAKETETSSDLMAKLRARGHSKFKKN
ncbi:DUF3006 domain-containing protein [Lentibacillus saliphilus]|uniref:DUF3006 domain-containing protein n=1 Tax=Lentibacillus saliphilus TaxID=2737028 RepID=UPI001C2FB22F|nr:DUF3006 domain-containing protein [Lentibacillus saliphilus]